jgi:hypothetical protein
MQRSIAVKVLKVTAAVTVIPIIGCVYEDPWLIVPFLFVAFVFAHGVFNRIEPGTGSPRGAFWDRTRAGSLSLLVISCRGLQLLCGALLRVIGICGI